MEMDQDRYIALLTAMEVRSEHLPKAVVHAAASCIGNQAIEQSAVSFKEGRDPATSAWFFVAVLGHALVVVHAFTPHANWFAGSHDRASEDATILARVIPMSEVTECQVDTVLSSGHRDWTATWRIGLRNDPDLIRLPIVAGNNGRQIHSDLGHAIANKIARPIA